MSDAIRALHDYLAKSPSVVYPEDILEYLPAIEAENARLRELLQRTWDAFHAATAREFVSVKNELRELVIEVDDG